MTKIKVGMTVENKNGVKMEVLRVYLGEVSLRVGGRMVTLPIMHVEKNFRIVKGGNL